jgi:hypothetical protein
MNMNIPLHGNGAGILMMIDDDLRDQRTCETPPVGGVCKPSIAVVTNPAIP